MEEPYTTETPAWKRRMAEIDARSEGVRDIMQKMPSLLLRWGTTVIAAGLAALILLSFLLRYPDTVPARVVVTTRQPPASVVARADGKIDELRVSDGAAVRAGKVLAVLENPARLTDVEALVQALDSFETGSAFRAPEASELGEIQDAYAAFLRHHQMQVFVDDLNPAGVEQRSIQRQISALNTLIRKQSTEKSVAKKAWELAKTNFRRNESLKRDGVVSAADLDQAMQEVIAARGAYQRTESALASTKIDLARLQRSRTQTSVSGRERSAELRVVLDESLRNLRAAIDRWYTRFVLRAPMDGEVTMVHYWSTAQYVRAGEEVMVIVPEDRSDLYGKLYMPVRNSGKVQVGQKVRIQFDSYPHHEFGTVFGEVRSIAAVPRDGNYAIEVRLPKGLTTSYQRQLEFRQEMQGNADIITEDLRVIERVFYKFKSLFDS